MLTNLSGIKESQGEVLLLCKSMQVEDPVAQPSPPIHNHTRGELTWQKNAQERMKKGKETKKKSPQF